MFLMFLIHENNLCDSTEVNSKVSPENFEKILSRAEQIQD